MKITPLQQYIILGLLGVAGLSVLFYYVALKPVNKEIKALIVTRDEKKKELEEAKRIVAKYAEFKKRADSVQRELEWIQNRIPKVIEKPTLAREINLVYRQAGVFLSNYQPASAPLAKDTYTEIPVNIRFNTDYKGLLKFLHQVSTSNLFMIVHDLAVGPASDPTHPSVTLSAQMIISGVQAK